MARSLTAAILAALSGTPHFYPDDGPRVRQMRRSRAGRPRRARRGPSRSKRDALHALSLRLENVREEERARVARELHHELQEALTNVVRHANAGAVHVTLSERGKLLLLVVKDNGRGITKAEISSVDAI